jgi:putative membrane protein
MPEFQSTRIIREYTQTNDAPPEKVFPLPGWQYRVIY